MAKFGFVFLLLIFYLLPLVSFSQYILKGKVVNGENEESIPIANLFLNNTTNGTSSGINGDFEMRILPGNHELVVSHIGFEPLIYQLPEATSHPYLIIRLKPIELDFEAVKVVGTRDKSWYFNLERFKYHFLGNSKMAEKCVIANPEVLIIDHDRSERTLKVNSKDYLVIDNPSLGYKLNFLLQEFYLEEKLGKVFFVGYPYFEENLPKNKLRVKSIEKRRLEAFHGSSMHWIRMLVHDQLVESQYKMYGIRRELKEEESSSDDLVLNGESIKLSLKIDTLNADSLASKKIGNLKKPEYREVIIDSLLTRDQILGQNEDGEYYIKYPHIIKVEFMGEKEEPNFGGFLNGPPKPFQTTYIHLQKELVFIDPAGYVRSPSDIFFEGYMGWEKVGALLPIDYQPDN